MFSCESLVLLLIVTEHHELLGVRAGQQPNSPNTMLRCQLVTLLVVAG